jgi:hypothetical protein
VHLGDIVKRGERAQALWAVIVRLREPFAGIDTVSQVLRALPGERRRLSNQIERNKKPSES